MAQRRIRSRTRPSDSGEHHVDRKPQRPRKLLIRRGIAFAVAAASVLVLAFQGGGYEEVVRDRFAIVLWALMAVGFLVGVLPRARLDRFATLVLGALAALIALYLLSLSWTESDERTFSELGRLLTYAGFVVLPISALSRYTWKAAAAGVMTAVLIVPCFSVLSRLAPSLIEDPAVALLGFDRLSYPLGYWNGVACLCLMAIAIGLASSGHARSLWLRALILSAVPVAILADYLTYSRAGVIVAVVAVPAAIAFSQRRWTVLVQGLAAGAGGGAAILAARSSDEIANAQGSEGAATVFLVLLGAAALCSAAVWFCAASGLDRFRLRPEVARPALAVGAVISVIALAVLAVGPLGKAWDEFSGSDTAAAEGDPSTRLSSFGSKRDEAWAVGMDAFEAEPLQGTGPGTFEFWWSREADDPEFLRDAHSLYIETLGELGLPGLLVLLLVLGGLGARGVLAWSALGRPSERGAAGALLAGFAVFCAYAAVDWVWELPAIAAAAIGGVAVVGSANAERLSASGVRPWPRLALGGLAVAVIALIVPALVSRERIEDSADALASGDVENARTLADEAVDAEPFAASPYVQRALAEEAAGDLTEARSSLQEAVEREPTNWRPHLLLARVAAREGDRTELKSQLAKARELAPNLLILSDDSPLLEEIQGLAVSP